MDCDDYHNIDPKKTINFLKNFTFLKMVRHIIKRQKKLYQQF